MIKSKHTSSETYGKMGENNRKRSLRSNTPAADLPSSPPTSTRSPVTFSAPSPMTTASGIIIIPPGTKLPGLSPAELTLLRRKQKKLIKTASSTLLSLPTGPKLINALNSSLIFAQESAGSAVLIDPLGWILTCSHCFCDFEYEYQADSKRRWLLFYTSLAVQIECRFWDPKRDLALCKIIAIESDVGKSGDVATFHYVRLASSAPRVKSSIICIGQPGADDLESKVARRTKYNLVEVSEGSFRGLVRDVDPQDNSDIGTMMHDAWTYWGHSGAPLLDAADGTLIGLHSSWDDSTAMRHGIPLVAIQEFLRDHLPSALLPDASDSAIVSVEQLQLEEEGPEHGVPKTKASTKKQNKSDKSSRLSPIVIDDH